MLETKQALSLDSGDGVTRLGLLWNPTADQLQVKNNTTQVQPTDSTKNTKRRVLATTASLINPLELLIPAVILFKTFLQKLWQYELQSDDLLPAYLQQEWNQLHHTIPQLPQIEIRGN